MIITFRRSPSKNRKPALSCATITDRHSDVFISRTSRCGEEKGQKIDVAAAPALDPHIAAFGRAQLSKMLREFRGQRLTFWIGRGITHEHADSPNSVRLLRGHWRPYDSRTSNSFDEITPPHCPPRA